MQVGEGDGDATDVLDRPVGETKVRWPGQAPRKGELPEFWPSWNEYWQSEPVTADTPLRPPVPAERWLAHVRRKVRLGEGLV